MALVLCVLLAGVLTLVTPEPDPFGVRYYEPGRDGWARAPELAVKVESVALTQQVNRTAGKFEMDPITTDAVFVVVDLSVAVRGRVSTLDRVSLVSADGRTYLQRREGGMGQLPMTDPGFTSHGTAVFEVPRDRVAGASLVVGPDSRGFVVVFRGAPRVPDVTRGAVERDSYAPAAPSTEVTR
ncbi:MAG TPA: hypothetical protein PLG38_04065 [Propionibacteriaceae bacterium]|nr:hypothetical protein [Propionibacteriaceae bacterium]HQE31181.1 hypothetical protein [Propionibacteriaceae bacterium]